MLSLFLILAEITHIGGLKLFNGREVLPSNPKLLTNPEKGWYYIKINDNSDLSKLASFNISASSKSILNGYWICEYLTSDQASILSTQYYVTEVLPEDKIQKSVLLTAESPDSKFLIYAHDSFHPPKNFHRFYKNYYISHSFPINLLDNKEVLFVDSYSNPQLLNHFSRGATQSEKFDVIFNGRLLEPNLPLHKHGITGEGQIVTVIDSGLDYRSCFFNDANHPQPVNITNLEHRKIVRYDAYADTTDFDYGHGTHVCGIIAGKALCCSDNNQCDQNYKDNNENFICANSLYNGHAPDAKLYFVDAGYASSPTDLGAEYDIEAILNQSIELKSYIMSNSWGFAPGSSIPIRRLFDEVGFEFPSITFFFGNGNSHKAFDTWCPANSKNIVGVGGTTRPAAQNIFSNENDHFYIENSNGDTMKCTMKNYDVFRSKITHDPIPSFEDQVVGTSIRVIPNISACNQFTNFDDNINLIVRSQTDDLCPELIEKKVSICEVESNSLLNRFTDGSKISLRVNFTSESNGPTYDIASFTSMGPSNTGLIKPDILAPGKDIMSATGFRLSRPHAQCGIDQLNSKSGTSMATPAAGGSAALATQYFLDGFYPSGHKNPSDSIIPFSPLIRALLANSAGTIHSSSIYPDTRKGFGIIHLSNSLVFDDEDRIKSFGLRIPKELIIFDGNRTELLTTIKLPPISSEIDQKRKPLTVTLAFIDPPTSKENQIPIFADLDLFIVSPSGKVTHGNQLPNDHEESHSTIERITVTEPEVGDYEIHITCPQYGTIDPVLASVIVNGPFPHLDFETNPKYLVFEEIESHRVKLNYNCTGHFCQHSVMPILNNEDVSIFTMTPRKPYYYYTYFEGGQLRVIVEHGRGNLLNAFVSLGQVAKFGGQHILYTMIQQNHTFVISEDQIPPKSYIYLTLYEAYNNRANVKVYREGNTFIPPPPTEEIQTPISSPTATLIPTEQTSQQQTTEHQHSSVQSIEEIVTATAEVSSTQLNKHSQFQNRLSFVVGFSALAYAIVSICVYLFCAPTPRERIAEIEESSSGNTRRRVNENQGLLAEQNPETL
ncbi:hypothetical protein TRFO_39445 [Tritrichomonas foetus]|uniref:Peptidase S8/S53 domain-containing protein n=1 Tax=Tritrichomonas foetus TaxID=1144522 RepID=A0A1J4JAU8_9EUKA|nr:hypothetical protein TRFO_39445 [Tritrichomonas foetus]|eukprot:OHS94380.1 hypothetical protein TRFO_39445 [Tritrichomonas foetus]